MTDSTERQAGRMEATLESYGERLTRIENDLARVAACVNQQRGGKNTMAAMLATAGAFGAAVAEVLHWLVRGRL